MGRVYSADITVHRRDPLRMLSPDIDGGSAMNWEQIAGNWKQAKGTVKEKWGQLTDDDLTMIAGKRDQLVGRVQERYGIAKEEAEREVNEWERTMH
jgi:uncharacterized protein YjbJ (UPF0337 family)